MIDWIKKRPVRFAGICLLIFTLATAIPILASYGIFNMDLRPAILTIDLLLLALGAGLTLVG